MTQGFFTRRGFVRESNWGSRLEGQMRKWAYGMRTLFIMLKYALEWLWRIFSMTAVQCCWFLLQETSSSFLATRLNMKLCKKPAVQWLVLVFIASGKTIQIIFCLAFDLPLTHEMIRSLGIAQTVTFVVISPCLSVFPFTYGLELFDGPAVENIVVGPRVGIEYVAREDVEAIWRFASAWISAPRNTLRPASSSPMSE